ncbi:hypothetical protein O181_008519 [Austropuccinia psidii MF-1]|uniref:Uncharacterized protein n=1 Tax=Austropuccinia psidii MF-1 TaxID=1389203 RepID=A0A9Q3GIY0_9BASI|nr:hypothetical protein [Austropuccinia psidii MF-1]
MVHTRNRSSYSVQPDGSGKGGRGKNRAKTGTPSSRKTHLREARFSPYSPRSVSTTFEMKSETELIQDNFLRVEPLLSGSHRDTSIQVQKLVQGIQGRRVGNIPKPLPGCYELPVTNKQLSASVEDHKALGRFESIILQGED